MERSLNPPHEFLIPAEYPLVHNNVNLYINQIDGNFLINLKWMDIYFINLKWFITFGLRHKYLVL